MAVACSGPAHAQPFSSQQSIAAAGAQSVHASDLDGDGDPDALYGSNVYGDARLAWYENLVGESGGGSNGFGTQQVITSNGTPSVFAADLDGDGDPDVLAASGFGKIDWYENQVGESGADGDGFGDQQTITNSVDAPLSVYAVDLDGDGDPDILSASQDDNKIAWYENLIGESGGGSDGFGDLQVITTSASSAQSVYATDIDGDSDTDVLSASFNDDKIAWYKNQIGENGADSDGFGNQQVVTTNADKARSVSAEDLDGDGDPDILSASQGDDKIAWYENLVGESGGGSDGFGPQQEITTNADGTWSVYATDLDGDSDPDALSASVLDDKVARYENQVGESGADSDGFGTQKVITNSANGAISAFASDLDGDSDPEVLSAIRDDDEIAWYENFSPAVPLYGTTGNEGDAGQGTLGGDAGWVLLAPPESGATFQSLSHGSPSHGGDDQFIEFGLPEGAMIFTYDAPTDSWDEVTSAESGNTLPSGEGFLAFVFDDEGTADADPVDPDLTLQFNGTGVVSSDVTRSGLGTGDQWVFLGHPFNEQPLDLTQLTASGNGQSIDAYSTTVQIYDRSTGTWDPGFTLDPNVDTGDKSTVWMGQGFFMECVDPQNDNCPTQVTLPIGAQVEGGQNDIVGYSNVTVAPSSQARLAQSMIVEAGGDTVATDAAAEVLLYEDATADWDRYDATKLAPFTSTYVTVSPLSPAGDSTRAAAQASLPWPDSSQTVEVPLAVTPVGVSGQATLRATQSSLPDGWAATLIDTKGTPDPGDDEEVSWTEDATYEFAIGEENSASARAPNDDDSRGASRPGALALEKRPAWTARPAAHKNNTDEAPPARFLLQVEASGTIPVELAGFEARRSEDEAVHLRWQTASETENAGFAVERRVGADRASGNADWSEIGFVEGGGTTDKPRTYQFTDTGLPFAADSLAYRLRQIDLDGTAHVSRTVVVGRPAVGTVQLRGTVPNPVRTRATIQYALPHATEVRLSVYDLLGRRVRTLVDERQTAGRKQAQLDATGLSSGTYLYRLTARGAARTGKLTVVR